MSQRYCDHTFFNIKNDVDHAVAACIYCGQVRHLYADGRVLIVIETGEVKKAYGNFNPNKTQS